MAAQSVAGDWKPSSYRNVTMTVNPDIAGNHGLTLIVLIQKGQDTSKSFGVSRSYFWMHHMSTVSTALHLSDVMPS